MKEDKRKRKEKVSSRGLKCGQLSVYSLPFLLDSLPPPKKALCR